MAQIQDRYNPSRKVSVDTAGALLIRGGGAGGSILVSEGAEEAMIVDDVTTSNVTYVCTAPIGSSSADAVWKVKKIDETSGYTVVTYADGNSNYDNVADNRATLTYS